MISVQDVRAQRGLAGVSEIPYEPLVLGQAAQKSSQDCQMGTKKVLNVWAVTFPVKGSTALPGYQRHPTGHSAM